MVVVGYYIDMPQELGVKFRDILQELITSGVEIMSYSEARKFIQTPRVCIHFFVNGEKDKLCGRRFDELFGFPVDYTIGRFKNPEDRFEGSLLDYVMEIEFRGR